MTRPLVIDGANLCLKAPPGMDNCYDIYVRQEEIEGVVYRTLELELTPEERQAVINGGTLCIRQMGTSWVPIAAYFEDPFA